MHLSFLFIAPCSVFAIESERIHWFTQWRYCGVIVAVSRTNFALSNSHSHHSSSESHNSNRKKLKWWIVTDLFGFVIGNAAKQQHFMTLWFSYCVGKLSRHGIMTSQTRELESERTQQRAKLKLVFSFGMKFAYIGGIMQCIWGMYEWERGQNIGQNLWKCKIPLGKWSGVKENVF